MGVSAAVGLGVEGCGGADDGEEGGYCGGLHGLLSCCFAWLIDSMDWDDLNFYVGNER